MPFSPSPPFSLNGVAYFSFCATWTIEYYAHITWVLTYIPTANHYDDGATDEHCVCVDMPYRGGATDSVATFVSDRYMRLFQLLIIVPTSALYGRHNTRQSFYSTQQ